MSGSIKWFIYTTDAGTDFAVKLDESNTEAVNAGTQDYPDASTLINALPRNIKPRVCIFESADKKVVRRCVALTPTVFGGVAPGSSFVTNGVTVTLSRKVGEQLSVPRGVDTGLDDGDAT